MDSSDLHLALDYVSGSGAVVSTEHRAALQSSLLLLQNAEKFSAVEFWGKVCGAGSSYYLSQGCPADPMGKKKAFYSMDCVTWAQLPEVHPVIAQSASQIRELFTGNPSTEFTVTEPAPADGDAALDLPTEVAALREETDKGDGTKVVKTTVSEDKRLAAVVAVVSKEVGIVPRGALVLQADKSVCASRTFSGLTASDAGKLQSYCHAGAVSNKRMNQDSLDKTLDFLEPISEDVPAPSWSLQFERGSGLVVLRSLVWLGYTFYHVPGTTRFGGVYFGNGQRNTDLPFMLP